MTLPVPDSPSSARTRLIEAAIFCFAEKGFDATGIREIAKRANANSALVQYHFAGKEGLYREALASIFQRRPARVAKPPADPTEPDARSRAIAGVGEMIESLVLELMSCNNGSPLDQASLFLVTRELQAPHPDAIPLILDHVRPYAEHMEACLRILRPDLSKELQLNLVMSIYGQVFHLHSSLAMIRIMRQDPDFPRDLQAIIRHFTEFSLRGIGIPEAFPFQA